jgi:hypothetical protein
LKTPCFSRWADRTIRTCQQRSSRGCVPEARVAAWKSI